MSAVTAEDDGPRKAPEGPDCAPGAQCDERRAAIMERARALGFPRLELWRRCVYQRAGEDAWTAGLAHPTSETLGWYEAALDAAETS